MKEIGEKIYRFGRFELHTDEPCLKAENEEISLTPKALQTLLYLVQNNSRVVKREELLDAVWEDAIVEENILSVNVSILRKVLNEDNDPENFIKTYPRKGYKFIAEVETLLPDSLDETFVIEKRTKAEITFEEIADEKTLDKYEKLALPPKRSSNLIYWLVGFSVLLLVIIGSVYWWQNEAVSENKIDSIAILPFRTIGADENDKVLSLGISDALITRLGKAEKIIVRPTSSVIRYADKDLDVLEVGKKLKVDAVLEGTFQHSEDKIRVTAKLLRVRDGKQIWAGIFDETENEFFKLQDDLSIQVANNLFAKLNEKENKNLRQAETKNLEAFRAYTKGQFFLDKRTNEDFEKAIGYFEKAIELDENYAPAYTALANSLLLLGDGGFGDSEPLKNADRIRKLINRSLELDTNSAETHNTLGFLEFNLEWDVEAALKSYEKSILINPNLAQTHHWYAWTLLARKRFAEAEAEIKLAQKLDPTSRIIAAEVGLPILYSGEYEKSIPNFRQAVEMDKNFFQSRFRLWYALHFSEKYEEAFEQLEAMKTLESEDFPFYLVPYAMTLAETGNQDEARRIFNQLEERKESGEYISPVLLASLAATIEDKDAAFKWLEEGFRERNDYMLYLDIAPEYEILRTDDRFQKLLEKIRSIQMLKVPFDD